MNQFNPVIRDTSLPAARVATKPPAGWYPNASGVQQWWDGSQWTNHFAPTAPPQVVVQQGRVYKTSHGVHLFLTLITFGLWAPVWIVMGCYNSAMNGK